MIALMQWALATHSQEAEGPESAAPMIGPLPHRGQAREWALVLQSQNIAFIIDHAPPVRAVGEDGALVEVDPGGWVLRVAPADYGRALASIDLYEQENENWPPPRIKDTPRHAPTPLVTLAFVALVLFFLYATGPAAGGSMWFSHGRADALRLFSEPWRMITALTLHADGQHVIGNAISGSIFGTMVARRIGPGGALLAILLSGIAGNTLNALHHLPEGHFSIGASTAVFGAVGMLAALQTLIDWRRREAENRPGYRLVDAVAPIVGGLALLGALGAGGENTDLWAHAYGFASGVGIGAVSGLVVRRPDSRPSRVWQIAAALAAFALVAGAWGVAAAV